MKKIYTGIILTAGLFLTACQNNMQDITIQSITEPIVTQQTVWNVPEVTTAVEATENTDDWTELAVTDGTDNTNPPEFDPPMQEIQTTTLEDVTLPDAIDGCMHSTWVEYMFNNELPTHAPDKYKAGESDYDECNVCYKKLLAERLINHCDRVELFGGAYFCNGRLQLKITDYNSRDEVFGDIFDGLESVNISSCYYSYSYLLDVQSAVIATEITYEEGLTGYGIGIKENRVYVTVSTEEIKEQVLFAVEKAGFDTDAVNIGVIDYVIADPC